MNKKKIVPLFRIAAAVIAVVFGLLTIFVGGQTLLGYSDPGYTVFTPLLIFNALMGFIYAGSGFLIWKKLSTGIKSAKIIFLINVAVLVLILVIYLTGELVAVDSIKAMSFRTGIWLMIWVGLLWCRK